MVYNGVYSHVMGEDRVDALKAIDDDEAFDRWQDNFSRKNDEITKGKKPRGTPVPKEKFQRKWSPDAKGKK